MTVFRMVIGLSLIVLGLFTAFGVGILAVDREALWLAPLLTFGVSWVFITAAVLILSDA